jgi:putative aldouronate transport system substrate-binding protein
LKKFKEENPESYPLTTLVEPRVLFRMTMPSFGISLGKNAASGTHVLSWDYDKKEYFAGAISDQYKEYLAYFAKLHKEGLLDPEMINSGDAWTSKLATGKSMASYAYYDQIGGIEGTSQVEGIKFNMYPPLVGPGGAHHQPKSKTASGVLFPTATAKRSDFKELVSVVDQMFFSEEMAELWCLGIEGETFTKNGDKIEFPDAIKNSPDGIYKTLQLNYGLGVDVLQLVWVNAREMFKYDENYAQINKIVADMPDSIQTLPPPAKFDDLQAEDAGFLRAPLADTFDIWADAFITGNKSVETDWDEYVNEMTSKDIEKFLALYNDNL